MREGSKNVVFQVDPKALGVVRVSGTPMVSISISLDSLSGVGLV